MVVSCVPYNNLSARCTEAFIFWINTWNLLIQDRLIKGTFFVDETYGAYKTIEELWDGEVWALCIIEMFTNTMLLELIDSASYLLHILKT